MKPNTQQVIDAFTNNASNRLSLLTIDNIKCEKINIGAVTIDSSGVIIDSATIGGLLIENETISGPSISFDSGSGVIDCGGATLINVGGIVTNPNYYTAVFQGVSTGIGQTVLAGVIPLSGNSIVIIDSQFIATRTNGSSICASYSYKTNYIGGLMTFTTYKNIPLASDETILDTASVTLSQSGSNIQVYANGIPLYSLSWIITVQVTILPL